MRSVVDKKKLRRSRDLGVLHNTETDLTVSPTPLHQRPRFNSVRVARSGDTPSTCLLQKEIHGNISSTALGRCVRWKGDVIAHIQRTYGTVFEDEPGVVCHVSFRKACSLHLLVSSADVVVTVLTVSNHGLLEPLPLP